MGNPTQTSRRTALRTGLAVGSAALVTGATAAGAAPRADARPTAAAVIPRSDPFTLGVASGDPEPDGFVIWTRLAVEPLAADGRGGMPSSTFRVNWQVATDERFEDVVRAGSTAADPAWAHSVHVEVAGLQPGREYFYRFRLGPHLSRSGRALTTPAPGSSPSSLHMAFASCSNYPAGLFTAYAALAAERPDVVLHLGDYQYEGAGPGVGRTHAGPETTTLAGYRQRHAQYKTDVDLQAAHAAAPWLVVWDDHEVDNNYADDIADRAVERPGFLDRRAAAYRAYYENMPLRRRSVPAGPDLDLYRRSTWGDLATLHMLDTRQYRSDQACNDGYKDCPAADDPSRSLPGLDQERWLLDGFRDSRQRWDILGQQVFFGRRDNDPSAATTVSMDSWDGYRPSRQRVTQGWVDAGVRNPVVLTGDVHAHWAGDLYLDYDAVGSTKPVGSELVTSSITSGGNGYDEADGTHPWAAWNPNLRFWTNLRGYVSTTITPTELTARFRCVPFVTTPGAEAFTRATFVIEDGVRGLQQEQAAPQRELRSSRTDAQKIADTIAAETHAG
ncbi:alkaline phosphatase [Knoellia flava TL1]|uniref:Alkaline phosphatase D n=2 Tax=Knoellia flava TaxID=913969 RepID=A0A8H9KU22_9MICO|nr:alkaline phosphatase D family protein [Knoellia flava]KGN35331.1 alkaline phosphatase [Knoellia flava TL1]GGB78293.1 alkaline phosphatase D [Knoellia flava]